MQTHPKTTLASASLAAEDATMRPWLSIARTFHLCDALMAFRLERLGLKMAEHEVLLNLRRDPGIDQQTIARRCFNAKSHISALVTALVARGWVSREVDSADARARKLYLTPTGQRIAAHAMAVQAQVAEMMAEAISPKALADVTTAMLKIGDRLKMLIDQAN